MAIDLGPNQHLIGVDRGRTVLSTPALVLDLDAAEKNIQAMAHHCQETGQNLRPHGKSHKSSRLAKMQAAAGAVGICCATIREAEAMAAAGVGGILITSPVATPAKIDRLIAIHRAGADVAVVSDNMANVEALHAAAAGGAPLPVVIDFDVGLHRTGVADDEQVALMARRIDDTDSLRFAGLQAYAGHLQHVEDYAERATLMAAQTARVQAAIDRLSQLGLPPAVVTGGGTGTHDIDHRGDVFGELQAGSYLFTDVQYNVVALTETGSNPFTPSLFVQAAVINVNHADHAVIDAGLKSFATDGPLPEIAAGAPPGASYRFMGDEHGAIHIDDAPAHIAVGDRVECVVPHCDPTVNLYDHYHCVRGDVLVDIWPIDARGNP